MKILAGADGSEKEGRPPGGCLEALIFRPATTPVNVKAA
jgi:hypothetical protein